MFWSFFRRRTNVQQLTCNIDLSSSFCYLFFSFVLIELKPFVSKGKVLGEKFWKSLKKCENSHPKHPILDPQKKVYVPHFPGKDAKKGPMHINFFGGETILPFSCCPLGFPWFLLPIGIFLACNLSFWLAMGVFFGLRRERVSEPLQRTVSKEAPLRLCTVHFEMITKLYLKTISSVGLGRVHPKWVQPDFDGFCWILTDFGTAGFCRILTDGRLRARLVRTWRFRAVPTSVVPSPALSIYVL